MILSFDVQLFGIVLITTIVLGGSIIYFLERDNGTLHATGTTGKEKNYPWLTVDYFSGKNFPKSQVKSVKADLKDVECRQHGRLNTLSIKHKSAMPAVF